jgi:hypothetical protein
MMKTMVQICILAFHFILNGQDIIPIPADLNAEWRITRSINNYTCADIYNSVYYVNGTAIYNGKEYYNIYETGEFYQQVISPPGPCDESYEFAGVYRGSIRTENGKVYQYYGNEEQLLMDFTLNVGDTLNSFIGWGLIIGSIDSVLIGDQYRKRFNFLNGDVCHWMIEGLGHERGLFEPMQLILEFYSEFHCYGESNVPLFGDLDCVLNVGTDEYFIGKNGLNIFPNPATSFITIQIQESIPIEQVSIYNHLGQKVLETKPVNNTMDVSMLKPGIYFLEVVTKDWSEMTKWIKY